MGEVQQVHLGTLVQVAEALEAVVCRCLGPRGGQVLFTKDTGEVLMTREGRRILTALHLVHPVARVLVSCVSAHCAATGDGAKSFVLLLAALLRGAQSTWQCQAGGVNSQGRIITGHLARGLLSFQTQILDSVMMENVVPCATSLFSCASPTEARSRMRLLLEAFFQGRVGAAHSEFLAEMAYDFYYRWNCEPDRAGTLQLISDHFSELHSSVTGFPIGRSQVLEGLVFHRDFAVYCPTEGPLKALAVSTALQPTLAEADSTLIITSSHQFQGCGRWITCQVEQTIYTLQQLQVKLLLSSMKQSELVLYHARRAGLSVVQCLDEDELSFFCCLTRTAPLTDMGDWAMVGNDHIASVTFCRPVGLGPHRYAHIGFPVGRDFLPHCLILCGPTPGLTDQCISAFSGAIRLLQQVCGALRRHSRHRGKRNIVRKICSLENQTNILAMDTKIHESRRDADSQPQTEAHEWWQRTLSAGEMHCCATQMDNTMHTSIKKSYEVQTECSCDQECDSGKPTEDGNRNASEMTDILLNPGAVLPAGGVFEFLLHHYLLKHAFHCRCPDTQAVCRLVAESLLSVPRQVYGGANRHFLKVHTRFMSAIQHGEPPWPVSESLVGLESLACKYQLLVSVLQCLGRLLNVDSIIHTTSLCVKHRATAEEQEKEEE